MMLDRFGNTIRVGWPDSHLLWLEAAVSLPRAQHTEAFQDIADMTGRSIHCVRVKAYAILQDKIDRQIAERARMQKAQHEAMVARREAARARAKLMAPSTIQAPSLKQLMVAR